MTPVLDELSRKLDGAVVEDPERGIYRARRDVFTDPDLFELEMKYIFEGNWIYLAHESQLANNNDYLTMYMGRQPIIISRDRKGQLHAVLNACAHRGAMVCRRTKDNRSTWTCPFHGWTYSNDGRLLKVKEGKGAGYPESFNTGGSHDMPKVPRFESYRGFLFGSLNPDVLPLEQHLGETTKLIDMMVDASPEGLEVLKGASSYTYDGNWKVQAENGADGYHVATVHWNYAATTARRSAGESTTETRAMDAGSYGKTRGGFYAFEHGHVLLWTTRANPEDEPIYERRQELIEQFGPAKANWMISIARNLCLYPNVYLMDQFSSQIRQYRPIEVDCTEGREPGGPRGPYPPVRGLLQRNRHGHAGRPRGVPLLAEGVPGAQRAVERHEPGRDALDQGSGRRSQGARPQPDPQRCPGRGRGSLPGAARLLAEGDAACGGR
jgi:benzoate/toluate 1,2-dioxygenase subunit alpha